jgi:hypothetical protein
MLSLIFLAACSPNHATIENGQWFAWLATNSSKVFIDESLPFLGSLDETDNYSEAMSVRLFECSGRVAGDDGYTKSQEGIQHTTGEDCSDINNISFENHKFLQNDGFYLLQEDIEPWRTEALINGEGDLQLTVHHALPDNEDFRFSFTIAPDFQPTTCTTDDQGQPQVEFVDGSDWLTRWSDDEEDYTIYYLNSGAYQINPSDTDDYWFLTTDWNSGFGHAKFSAEEFNSVPTAYGNYDEDGGGDDFMFTDNRNAPDYTGYGTAVDGLTTQVATWQDELAVAAGANIDGVGYFSHKVEGNNWRPINTSNAGLDGWAEVHSSWVRLNNSSEVVDGGTVTGDFQIMYTASESNSQLLVSGSFTIEDLKEDPWSYPIMEDYKRAENGTDFCGGAALGE